MCQCSNYNIGMDPLFTSAPDFGQPLAVLKHCHDRIRKQLATLGRLVDHLPEFGANVDAKQAANAVMKYFNHAAANHHEDEEHDLLPMLQATAQGDDAELLKKRIPQLLQEHRTMDAAWKELNQQLAAIASGTGATLSSEDVRRFSDTYTTHMAIEEADIAPMAKRIFNDAQMTHLGEAMRARRNIIQ